MALQGGRKMINRLLAAHPEAEIWWDSLPSAYAPWARALLAQVAPGDRETLADRLDRLVSPEAPERGLLTGATTNPRLVLEGLRQTPRPQGEDGDPLSRYQRLYEALFREDAHRLAPMWERSAGRHGWVCAQLSPASTYDTEALVAEGTALAALAPNLMIKVAGSREGLAAIERLTARGIATNATLVFSVAQVEATLAALERGLAAARRDGVDLSRWRAVVTFMVGRLGQEAEVREQAAARGVPLDLAALRAAELAVFERAERCVAAFEGPVKLLLCSLKLDREGDRATCRHLEGAIGRGCVVTLPPALLATLLTAELAPSAPVEVSQVEAILGLPYFAEALASEGLAPSAFGFQPAFLRGLQEVNQAYGQTLEWLRQGGAE